MVIYKYNLQFTDFQQVIMPIGAMILSVEMQGNLICIWAMVDQSQTKTERRGIEIFGTGQPMSDRERKYIGTVLDGQFVWHVFERV